METTQFAASTTEFPPSLVGALKARRCIPFVGAGVSRAVTEQDGRTPLFPSWGELLHLFAQEVRKKCSARDADELQKQLAVAAPNFPAVAQSIFRLLGPATWKATLRALFARQVKEAAPESLALANGIWQLGGRRIITTNFDDVLAWAQPLSSRCTSRQRAEVGEFIRYEQPVHRIWHLHGHIEALDSLVLKKDEYQNLYSHGGTPEHAAFAPGRIGLPMIMARESLLFIGYGFGDHELVREFLQLAETFGLGSGEHFILVRASESAAFDRYLPYLRPLPYPAHGTSLVETLARLANAAEIHDVPSRASGVTPASVVSDAIGAPNGQPFSNTDPFLVSFVAGKGGVGKTLLATAAAAHFAESAETLLVDLDFFNRGLGGLLKWNRAHTPDRSKPVEVGFIEGVALGVKNEESWCAYRLAPGLQVLSPRLEPAEERALQQHTLSELRGRLGEWLREAAKKTRACVVILDCHGSGDYISVAATVLAQHSFVVTEPEPLAADGTENFLKLLDDWKVDKSGRVHLIYNRVPPGWSWRELYSDYVERYRDKLENATAFHESDSLPTATAEKNAEKPSAFAVFPREEYLARNLRHHPLLTRDYPESEVARRMRVLLRDLDARSCELLNHLVPGSKRPAVRPGPYDRWHAHHTNGHRPALLRTESLIGFAVVFLLCSFLISWVSQFHQAHRKRQTQIIHEMIVIAFAAGEGYPGLSFGHEAADWRDTAAKFTKPPGENLIRKELPIMDPRTWSFEGLSKSEENSQSRALMRTEELQSFFEARAQKLTSLRLNLKNPNYAADLSDSQINKAVRYLQTPDCGINQIASPWREKLQRWRDVLITIPLWSPRLSAFLLWWSRYSPSMALTIVVAGVSFVLVHVQEATRINLQAQFQRRRQLSAAILVSVESAVVLLAVASFVRWPDEGLNSLIQADADRPIIALLAGQEIHGEPIVRSLTSLVLIIWVARGLWTSLRRIREWPWEEVSGLRRGIYILRGALFAGALSVLGGVAIGQFGATRAALRAALGWPAPTASDASGVFDAPIPPKKTSDAETPETPPPEILPAPSQVPSANLPYAKPVEGKPGYVLSPYAPTSGYVDVSDFPPGTEVKDPYSGQIFLVPATSPQPKK